MVCTGVASIYISRSVVALDHYLPILEEKIRSSTEQALPVGAYSVAPKDTQVVCSEINRRQGIRV